MLSPVELARIAVLRPELRNALPALVDRVEARTGKRVHITSGLRSHAKQQYLWDHRAENPNPVAIPGTSFHEYGAGVDVSIDGGTQQDYATLADVAQNDFGFCSGYPADPGHIRLNESLSDAQSAWAQLQQQRVTIAGCVVVVGIAIAFTTSAVQRTRR